MKKKIALKRNVKLIFIYLVSNMVTSIIYFLQRTIYWQTVNRTIYRVLTSGVYFLVVATLPA